MSYFYVTKGSEVHRNVSRKKDDVQLAFTRLFSDVSFSFAFLCDRDIVALARQKPTLTRVLRSMQPPMQTTRAFIALVGLRELFAFVNEGGKLARHMFDSNVRDHQGKTEVNSDIQKTLTEVGPREDFWWLNNGVTILAESARVEPSGIQIKNPQIVNGVQTSTEIYNFFSSVPVDREEARNILVRVIVPEDGESEDRIIKATNSQNAVSAASLRSTDKVHRDIEQFFRINGLFYDRRKNFYKNEGRPLAKIVGIPYLAQAVISVALKRPDSAEPDLPLY